MAAGTLTAQVAISEFLDRMHAEKLARQLAAAEALALAGSIASAAGACLGRCACLHRAGGV